MNSSRSPEFSTLIKTYDHELTAEEECREAAKFLVSGFTASERRTERLCASFLLLLAGVGLFAVVYNIWTGWYFAAGCFFALPTLPLLCASYSIWNDHG